MAHAPEILQEAEGRRGAWKGGSCDQMTTLRSLTVPFLTSYTVVLRGWGCLPYTKFERHTGGPAGSRPRGGETGELH